MGHFMELQNFGMKIGPILWVSTLRLGTAKCSHRTGTMARVRGQVLLTQSVIPSTEDPSTANLTPYPKSQPLAFSLLDSLSLSSTRECFSPIFSKDSWS